jgi:hypothetical protein
MQTNGFLWRGRKSKGDVFGLLTGFRTLWRKNRCGVVCIECKVRFIVVWSWLKKMGLRKLSMLDLDRETDLVARAR